MRDQVLSIDQMKHLKDLDIDTSEATLYWTRRCHGEVLYYIPIVEQIPKFNEKFLLGISDILIGYWWPRTDTESRIKAFDKLIDYYNPKGV